jgi:hypothetical protein
VQDRRLAAQLEGIAVACEVFGGARIPFRELVERCYGVAPARVPEEVFEAAHERLDAALPGRGSVRERFARWQSSQLVAPELIGPALDVLAAELRGRTRDAFGLPAGERVEIEIVRGKRWRAYASYQGALRTHIALNADLPQPAYELLEAVAHEIYPGHHTEHVLKDGLEGYDAYVYPTPQALVSEGVAMLARRALLGDDADAVAAARLKPLGLEYDAETAAVVSDVELALAPVRANIAIALDEEGLDAAGAHAYARRWLVEPDAYVKKLVEVQLDDPWPPYVCCYTEGLELCRAFAERESGGFRRLLTEPLTTADLVSKPTIG